MAKADRFPEFPTDWHQEQYVRDLERELAGRLARVKELKSMSTLPEDMAQAESEVAAVREQLKRFGKGQKSAPKRPKAAKETRKK